MQKVTFKCEVCSKERTEPFCWYKKRKHHYCSRQCANLKNNKDKWSGLSRCEYEKQYWAKPENSLRRKTLSSAAREKRIKSLGDSYKKEMINRCKARAIAKGIDFNIDITDINIPNICPMLGIKLHVNRGSGGSHNSPSLDRIDNLKGYVKGNVHVISKRANVIKSDSSFDELEKIYNWVKLNVPHS